MQGCACAPDDKSIIAGHRSRPSVSGKRIADVFNAVSARRGRRSRSWKVPRAWDMAFWAAPFRWATASSHAPAEYPSNHLAFLEMKARVGIEIDVVNNETSGQWEGLKVRIC